MNVVIVQARELGGSAGVDHVVPGAGSETRADRIYPAALDPQISDAVAAENPRVPDQCADVDPRLRRGARVATALSSR